MLRRSEVMVDGVRSVALQGGPASGESGYCFRARQSRFLPRLGRATGAGQRIFPLSCPDMPGFGQADKPKEFDYTVAGYARHLGGLLTKLQVRRAHLVLHDFGGPWGLAWAIANPTALASVTLINTGVLPDYRWHYLARVWRAPMLGEIFMASSTRLGFHLLLKHGNPRGLPKSFIDGMFDHFDSGTNERFCDFIVPPITLQKWPNVLATFCGAGPARRWSSGATPIPIFRSATPNASATIFPEHRWLFLESSGHWPYADDPERVARFCCHF
jgi:pimeloyl-ACP methyl ester carboxylesterase